MSDENTKPTETPDSAASALSAGLGAWLPIETAPKDGIEVLVYAYGHYAVAYWDGSEWRDMGDIGWAGMYGDDNQPTHWMPLPEAPNALVQRDSTLENIGLVGADHSGKWDGPRYEHERSYYCVTVLE